MQMQINIYIRKVIALIIALSIKYYLGPKVKVRGIRCITLAIDKKPEGRKEGARSFLYLYLNFLKSPRTSRIVSRPVETVSIILSLNYLPPRSCSTINFNVHNNLIYLIPSLCDFTCTNTKTHKMAFSRLALQYRLLVSPSPSLVSKTQILSDMSTGIQNFQKQKWSFELPKRMLSTRATDEKSDGREIAVSEGDKKSKLFPKRSRDRGGLLRNNLNLVPSLSGMKVMLNSQKVV